MSFYSKHKYQLKTIRRKTVLLLLFPPLLFTILLFRILPVKWVHAFAGFGGMLFYKFGKNSRDRALKNLRMIYGKELAENEIVSFTSSKKTSSATCKFKNKIKSLFVLRV